MLISFRILLVLSALVTIPSLAKRFEKAHPPTPSEKAEYLNFPSLAPLNTNRSNITKLDSEISKDWGLRKVGLFDIFTSYFQLSSKEQKCSGDVVVAVVDTGIDYLHPELRDNLWVNEKEVGPWEPKELANFTSCRDRSCNGIDDDNNGYPDDVVGWDFVNEVPRPWDVHGHGTHIAGIVANTAVKVNLGNGLCPGARIMALKYYDATGSGANNLQNTVKAFEYAIKMGADIINYSGGGAEPAFSERQVVEEAQRRGILLVAAAGNDGHDNKVSPYYPASYPLDNVISVASIDKEGHLLPSSNFGTVVHVAAPGHQILSSMPQSQFGRMSGTSQATAFVTGAAALLMSQWKQKSDFDYRKIKEWIVKTSTPLDGNTRHHLVQGGILSISNAIHTEREEIQKAEGLKKSFASKK